jgi:hypothetical protein
MGRHVLNLASQKERISSTGPSPLVKTERTAVPEISCPVRNSRRLQKPNNIIWVYVMYHRQSPLELKIGFVEYLELFFYLRFDGSDCLMMHLFWTSDFLFLRVE